MNGRWRILLLLLLLLLGAATGVGGGGAPTAPRLPEGLHRALVDYGEWHNRTTPQLEAQLPILQQFLSAANGSHPSPTGSPPRGFPPVVVACGCHSGLADTLKAAVDLFLVALLTRRLFFLVCPTTPWPETFLASPYFRWTRPWVKAQAVAYLRAVESVDRRVDLPLEDGGRCGRGHNEWPRYLAARDLREAFPALYYLARDNHHPQLPWLLQNTRHRPQLRAWGLLAAEVEDAHGALQRALFQPTPALAERLRPVLSRFSPGHTIGLHFRTRGHPRWGDPPRLEGSGVRCHLKCALALLRHLRPAAPPAAPARVFVAADRPAERNAAVQALGAAAVILQAAPIIAHVAAKYNASQEGVAAALVDFFALAHCSHLVVPASGFSIVAAWRAGRPYLLNPFPKPCLGSLPTWCPAARYPADFAARRDAAFQWGAVWRACSAPRPALRRL